jgi:hypothetical protein
MPRSRPRTGRARFRSLWVSALTTSILLTAAVFVPAGPLAAQEPESESDIIWREFQADRTALYNNLAPPIVDCFKRRDSLIDPGSPIFHGCLDWHSAVHAAYSHHALYHHTGAYGYLNLAEEQIAPRGVSLIPAEEAYEKAKALPDGLPVTENPYGFGWFLVLARERELSTGKTDLRPMANFAADQMVAWFQTRKTNNDAGTYINNTAHPNYSFSLLNLDVWARYTNNPTLLAAVREASKPLFTTNCPVTRDDDATASGFQPACLMRLAAIAHIWGDSVKSWVESKIPVGFHVPPVESPGGCHQGGLNFTRSFALYQLYLLTGNTDYRDNYVELIRYHVAHPEFYVGPDYLGNPAYDCYAHWVAQVGVRSISESFEAKPSTPDDLPPI